MRVLKEHLETLLRSSACCKPDFLRTLSCSSKLIDAAWHSSSYIVPEAHTVAACESLSPRRKLVSGVSPINLKDVTVRDALDTPGAKLTRRIVSTRYSYVQLAALAHAPSSLDHTSSCRQWLGRSFEPDPSQVEYRTVCDQLRRVVSTTGRTQKNASTTL